MRRTFFRHAIAKIGKHDEQAVIKLCSETTLIRRLLGDVVDTKTCNCLP